MSTVEKRRNLAISIIKGLAIFSVICAHCNSVAPGSGLIAKYSSKMLQCLGTYGVGCFFIISGALYSISGHSVKSFFYTRVLRIGIPWIISSTVVFLYVALRKPPITADRWFKFMIGDNSYLYYITVLFVLYLLYAIPFFRTKTCELLCVLITILSTVFFYDLKIITPYFNIFNWIGYFSLGLLIRDNVDGFERLMHRMLKFRGVIYLLTIASICMNALLIKSSYWGFPQIISVFLGIGSILFIGTSLCINNKGTRLIKYGDNSLFIYLWHMPIAGIVANLMNRQILCNFVLLRPFIVMFFMGVVMGIMNRVYLSIYKTVGFIRYNIDT